MAYILSFVVQIQLKILHDIDKCVFLIAQNLEVIRRITFLLSPSKNVQFCNEQIRTRPLFSPPCASATYGSARMCRRKNSEELYN